MSLQGKVALVTGASRGIGQAIALELGRQGAVVVGTATSAAGAERIAETLKSNGIQGGGLVLDVGSDESVTAALAQIQEQYGQLAILVNNAGITRDATLRKLDKAGWDAVLRTNLDSMFNVTKPFIDPMVERGWGRIVNISSINGSKGQFGQTNYSAAKAGVHGFTKALAQEVARKGVTVNTVSPGYLATEMVMAVREDMRQKIIDAIPVGRLGQPDEIAALVAFIASEAAAFMTGSNVAMNGGQHMY